MVDTAEIQEKVNATRARLDASLTELNERIEPKALMEHSMNYLRDNGPDMARGGLDFIRENPLAVGITAAGLTWLALGGGPSSSALARRAKQPFAAEPAQTHDSLAFNVYADDEMAGDYAPHHSAFGDDSTAAGRATELTSKAKAKVGDLAEVASDQASKAANRVAELGADATAGAKDFSADVAASSRDAFDAGVQYAQAAAKDPMEFGSRQLSERPLAVGAVALLGGVALAMLIPRTRAETKVLGDKAGQAREAAVRRSQQAYSAARQQADSVAGKLKQQASEVAGEVKKTVKASANEVADELKAAASTKTESEPHSEVKPEAKSGPLEPANSPSSSA